MSTLFFHNSYVDIYLMYNVRCTSRPHTSNLAVFTSKLDMFTNPRNVMNGLCILWYFPVLNDDVIHNVYKQHEAHEVVVNASNPQTFANQPILS